MTALDHSHHVTAAPQGSFWTSRTFFFSLAFSAVAVFLLLSEHRAHVFMHGGHGSHSGHGDPPGAKPQDTKGASS